MPNSNIIKITPEEKWEGKAFGKRRAETSNYDKRGQKDPNKIALDSRCSFYSEIAVEKYLSYNGYNVSKTDKTIHSRGQKSWRPDFTISKDEKEIYIHVKSQLVSQSLIHGESYTIQYRDSDGWGTDMHLINGPNENHFITICQISNPNLDNIYVTIRKTFPVSLINKYSLLKLPNAICLQEYKRVIFFNDIEEAIKKENSQNAI